MGWPKRRGEESLDRDNDLVNNINLWIICSIARALHTTKGSLNTPLAPAGTTFICCVRCS